MEAAKTRVLLDHGVMTRAQLVAELDITDETLAKMEREDSFPSRKSGRTILYDVTLIKNWIAKKPRK